MEVELENAAFDGDPRIELSVILADVIVKVVKSENVVGTCMDSNGNTIGGWKIVDE
jgi:hypothetical protein